MDQQQALIGSFPADLARSELSVHLCAFIVYRIWQKIQIPKDPPHLFGSER